MSNTKNTGGPAYPVKTPTPGYNFETVHQGMTLRDHFAGLAMQGIVSGKINYDGMAAFSDDDAAQCYIIADAMLNAR
jgi:hypothetical protein